jgi:methionine-gamma-lyase
MEGCYLYSRHSSPSNLYLDKALAAMEGTEAANVSASGMGAITPTLLRAELSRSLFRAEQFMVEHMLS